MDTYYSPEKTYGILIAAHTFNDKALKALKTNVPVEEIQVIEAALRPNRIGVREDWEVYIENPETGVAE